MSWARAGSLTNYPEVARRVGIDPIRMLRRARIDPDRLAYSETRIPAAAFAELLEESALESATPHFGLLLAETRSLSELGPISLLLQHQETLRGVIDSFVRFQHLLAGVIALELEELDEAAILHTNLVLAVPFPPRQALEYMMGTLYRSCAALGGSSWRPEQTHFRHRAPASLAAHRRLFGRSLLFASGFNGFAYRPDTLAAVNRAAEGRMEGYARTYLETLLPAPSRGSTGENARRAIHLLLPTGRASIERVAEHLGVAPRRLQRQLEREGKSFSALLNDARRELAARYLSATGYSVSAIATMMGYTSLSSFTRWFTHEFGIAPSAWRKSAWRKAA